MVTTSIQIIPNINNSPIFFNKSLVWFFNLSLLFEIELGFYEKIWEKRYGYSLFSRSYTKV